MKQRITLFFLFCTYTVMAQPTWQQRVDSKIDVLLDDKKHILYGYEELTYTNNSPDTLRFIYMHLWPNAYKHDRTPFAKQQDVNGNTAFYYSKRGDRGYIDSLTFMVDDRAADHYSTESSPDIARLDLPTPLLPGRTMKIATPFKVKIPKVFSRMGHTGQSYYISQWFPKPAVYDKEGWHPISYLDQGEFYSEFGSYDVRITLPANYVVMATGNCMDEKENKWLDELAQKPLPATRFKFTFQRSDSTPPSALEMKTLHFHEDNVHDFAWFADKRWMVRKDTVASPGNNLVVTTWAAFMPSYWQQWQKATDYLKETVRYYGKWVGPYQYKTIKAVLGDLKAGGGMEYPTVTLIDKLASAKLDMVVRHEAGHNWFYGMLGSNERDHGWMDEGMNTFYEQKTTHVIERTNPNLEKKSFEALLYFERAATHRDQPVEQTAANFEKLNIGLDLYIKCAMMLRWLESYMGEADFEAGMKDYYDTWHFHHPYPQDFRVCMQRHTAKSLDWFFDTILNTDKRVDFKITKAKVDGNNTEVVVKNRTGINSSVQVTAYKKDSIVATSAWSSPSDGTVRLSLATSDWNRLKISDVIPDGKPTNDLYRRKALFHTFGLSLRPFFGRNLSNRDKLFIAPALGYNQYDGIMGGLLLHNLTMPENRFRFAVAPLYSFGTSTMVGTGSVGYVWYSDGPFKEIMLQTDAKTFHYNEMFQNFNSVGFIPRHLIAGYTKVAPSLSLTINEHDPLSPVTRTITLKGYSITEDNFVPVAPGPSVIENTIAAKNTNYGLLRYSHTNARTYNPFDYSIEAHGNGDFAKLNIEGNLRVDYEAKKKSLYIRAYFGKFFAMSNTTAIISRYQLNASYTGRNDYLYDGTYIARSANDKIASQQLSIQEGGFKVPTLNNAARSDNWMAALNLKTDLPIKYLPIRLFLDAGLIPNSSPSFTRPGSTTLLYDAGIEVYINKVASLYIPLIMSNDFQNNLTDSYGNGNVFGRSISFTLQLYNINWLKTPEKTLRSLIK